MSLPRHPHDLEVLDEDECLRLLATVPFVRLGFQTPKGPTILPVNHLLFERDLYFRTEAGSKLGTAAAEAPVAVQADGVDEAHHLGWSVVAHGRSSIVTEPSVVERLMATDFTPWTGPDAKLFWVRVHFDEISGRRIVSGEPR